MISFFRHSYLKYLILLCLTIKLGYYVVEKNDLLSEISTCFVLDVDDFENENEEPLELDENKKITEPFFYSYTFISSDLRKKYIELPKIYRNLYIKYTPPPPEFS